MRASSAIIGGLIGSFIASNWQTLLVLALAAAAYQHFEYPHGTIDTSAYGTSVINPDPNATGDAVIGSQLEVGVTNDTDDRIVTGVKTVCAHGSATFRHLYLKPSQYISLESGFIPAAPDKLGYCNSTYETQPV